MAPLSEPLSIACGDDDNHDGDNNGGDSDDDDDDDMEIVMESGVGVWLARSGLGLDSGGRYY